jgi:hypothetical protein
MAERKVLVKLVAIPAPVTDLGQIARLLKVVDDLSSCSFGDPDGVRDISETGGRIR